MKRLSTDLTESGRYWEILGDIGNFIERHGELDPNSKTSGEVQTRQKTICLFREPLRIQGQPPQLDSRRGGGLGKTAVRRGAALALLTRDRTGGVSVSVMMDRFCLLVGAS